MPNTTCAKCHVSVPADAEFCPNCGTRQTATAAAPAPPIGGARTLSGQSTITPLRQRETTTLEPGSMFADRYEVIRRIGAGGMGVVYLAKDTHTGEELVLKLIHPDLVDGEDAVKRLLAEGLTARQIRHPKIVAVFDVSQYNDQPYFTMEYVRGGSLRSWMANHMAGGKDVSLPTAAGIIKSMLAGITEAHRMGFVHRDLKPENVLLVGEPDSGNFDLKVLDFGIAKAVNAPRTSSGSSGPMGTPLYMAPEQMTAPETVGPAADLYSLSVMFYELLMEASPQARWEPVSKSRPDVPKAIDDLIEKGLSVRPRSRPTSAAEYEKALDAALGSVQPEPAPPPPPPPPPVDVRPRPIPDPPLPPPPPGPPPPRPNPDVRSAWAKLPGAAKLAVYGIAGLVAISVIAMMSGGSGPADTDGDGIVDAADGCVTLPGPAANNGCPVTVPPGGGGRSGGTVVAPREERWRDDSGNVYIVDREGATFEGDAENVKVNGVSYGHVDIEGAVTPGSGRIRMTNARGVVYQSPIGTTQPGTDPRTTDALFGSVRFHIDH